MEAVEPSVCQFHDPTAVAEPLAALDAAPCSPRWGGRCRLQVGHCLRELAAVGESGLLLFGGPGSKLVHRRSRDDGRVSKRC